MLRKEVTGYAAFDKESGKGLAIQYGITNRLSLTEDPDKVDLEPNEKIVETHIFWFNDTHKNQKEFVIKKVVRITEIQEENKTNRFFVAKARNGYCKYFTYEGTDFPTLDVPNPMDYEILEITEEEYKKNEKHYI